MALTVEDGSGFGSADSYVSVADADTFVTKYLRDSASWGDLTTALKEQYLVEATQTLDLIYGRRYRGYMKSSTQALQWPRMGANDDQGYSWASTAIPQQLADATVLMAWKHLSDTTGPSTTTGETSSVIPDTDSAQNVLEESVEVGPIKTRKRYSGEKTTGKTFRKIELMLRELLNPRGQVARG